VESSWIIQNPTVAVASPPRKQEEVGCYIVEEVTRESFEETVYPKVHGIQRILCRYHMHSHVIAAIFVS